MKIKLELKNNSDKNSLFELFNILNSPNVNFGIPKDVEILIKIIDEEKNKENIIEYYSLLCDLMYSPKVCEYVNVTNPRQINFLRFDIVGEKKPIIPQLNLDGKRRCKNGYTEFSPCNWNIADTKECFILDWRTIISIMLYLKQKFEIEFQISKKLTLIENPLIENPLTKNQCNVSSSPLI